MRCCADRRGLAAALLVLLLAFALPPGPARAGTPLSLYRTHAGPVDYTGTGGTLRTGSNAGDACSIGASDSGLLSGIPGGATIEAAYLYWAGSYSDTWWSTQRTPDWDVVFDGQPVQADRMWTETFSNGGTTYDFFSGFEDVTAQVAAKGNGTYTFSGLGVNTDDPHCPVQAVVAGWTLVVVYSRPNFPTRVVNVYDGFQFYRGGEISLTMDNFRIAETDISGKASHVTWEGDAENSGSLGGYSENMLVNGASLTDAFNPLNNQFNSTINVLGSATEWGVDFDVYDIGPLLGPGDTSATAVYRSGQDLVLLSAEVISVANAPCADLSLDLALAEPLAVNEEAEIEVTVHNDGPDGESGPMQVTLTLPAGYTYSGVSGGWSADVTGAPVYVFSSTASIPAGGDRSFTLRIVPTASAVDGAQLFATVTGSEFDFDLTNNTTTLVLNPGTGSADLVVVQHTQVLNDPVNGTTNPKAIPGAVVLYTLDVSNTLAVPIDDGSVVLTVPVPVGVSLMVGDLAGAGSGPVLFVDGTPGSDLVYDYRGLTNRRDDLQFSRNGNNWNYRPRADALGLDTAVRFLRVAPGGAFAPALAAGNPNFSLRFQAVVD